MCKYFDRRCPRCGSTNESSLEYCNLGNSGKLCLNMDAALASGGESPIVLIKCLSLKKSQKDGMGLSLDVKKIVKDVVHIHSLCPFCAYTKSDPSLIDDFVIDL